MCSKVEFIGIGKVDVDSTLHFREKDMHVMMTIQMTTRRVLYVELTCMV